MSKALRDYDDQLDDFVSDDSKHRLVNPDGTPYLSAADKQFEDINKKLEVLHTMIMTTNEQLDKYANAVDTVRDQVDGCIRLVEDWGKRITQMKNLVKVMWTKRNDY